MEEYEKYLKYIIRFLSYRQRSEKEICDKLKEKNASTEITETIMQFLKQHKLVNDEEFANSWIRSRQNFRPKSKKAIKMELLKKGIDEQIIEKALTGDEEKESISDTEQAIRLIQKRINRYEGLSKQEVYQKLSGFLARRGFSWDTIKLAIDQCLKAKH